MFLSLFVPCPLSRPDFGTLGFIPELMKSDLGAFRWSGADMLKGHMLDRYHYQHCTKYFGALETNSGCLSRLEAFQFHYSSQPITPDEHGQTQLSCALGTRTVRRSICSGYARSQ
jgi:hypothetical protein